MQDFFGAGGGISSFPWCFGFSCHFFLASLYLSETRSLRWEREAVRDHATFPAACPASLSAFSFPGISMCPLTHTIFADPPCPRMSTRILWIDLAIRCPGPAPQCLQRAMALWESEWMMRCGRVVKLSSYHSRAASTAVSSASNAVCLSPMVSEPCAITGPLPISSSVIIHPRPADFRNEPAAPLRGSGHT
jgi:hypothetical protein